MSGSESVSGADSSAEPALPPYVFEEEVSRAGKWLPQGPGKVRARGFTAPTGQPASCPFHGFAATDKRWRTARHLYQCLLGRQGQALSGRDVDVLWRFEQAATRRGVSEMASLGRGQVPRQGTVAAVRPLGVSRPLRPLRVRRGRRRERCGRC